MRPKGPSIDNWIKEVAHIHSGTLLSHKKEILPFVTTWMDVEDVMLSEISQTEKDTAWSHLQVESKT